MRRFEISDLKLKFAIQISDFNILKLKHQGSQLRISNLKFQI